MMTLEYAPWSGGFTSPDGNCIHPYKVEGGQPRDIHEARESNVHEGEANDPRNYR